MYSGWTDEEEPEKIVSNQKKRCKLRIWANSDIGTPTTAQPDERAKLEYKYKSAINISTKNWNYTNKKYRWHVIL